MIKLKSLIRESYVDGRVTDEYSDIYNEMQEEFQRGQKYQTWHLIPAKDILLIWAIFAKYGRVDENKLDKVWQIVKENVLKIIINTQVWNGSDPEFFGKENYKDITQGEWDRHSLFVADRSNSQYIRNTGEVEGNARYSDQHNRLFQYLEKCYSVDSAEELLMGIDLVLNFVHGLGGMAKWFVEGGETTLNKIRDFEAKGISLRGQLSEGFFKSIKSRGIPKIDDSIIGMDISIGNERYIATLNTIPDEGKYRLGGIYVNDKGQEEAFTHVSGNSWKDVLRHLPQHFIHGADVITYRKSV